MVVHFSVCVSAHTLLIMDFKVLGEMVNARCSIFKRVFTQENQLENGMEGWNYAVEHKIITCHLPNSNSSHEVIHHMPLHVMNYC